MSLRNTLLLICAMMVMAFNAIITKLGVSEFSPIFFNFLRFAFIIPMLFFIPRPQISWVSLTIISLSLGVVMITLFNLGLALGASAALATLIFQTGSLSTLFFDFVFSKNKPNRWDLVAVAFGLTGVYWICSSRGIAGGPKAITILLLAAIMYGVGFALAKKVKAPSLPLTVWMSSIAVPVLAIMTLSIDGLAPTLESIASASFKGWGSAIFAGCVNMVGAGSLIMYLNRVEGVSKTAPYNMLIPVFGCLFAAVLFGEKFPPALYIGGAWIFSGLIISRFGPKLLPKKSSY